MFISKLVQFSSLYLNPRVCYEAQISNKNFLVICFFIGGYIASSGVSQSKTPMSCRGLEQVKVTVLDITYLNGIYVGNRNNPNEIGVVGQTAKFWLRAASVIEVTVKRIPAEQN